MNFTQPAFLWTFAAMGIPLAVHLLSRREGKVIKVGSLRHIEVSTTSRFKSLRLNELLLLVVRCLMVMWLALFLSGATCSSANPPRKGGWLLTEGGMHRNQLVRPLIDSLRDEGFEWRTLTAGFPRYDAADSITNGEYWDLAEELEDADRDVVVISYNILERFTKKRPAMPANVRWITVEPTSREFIAMATRLEGDTIAVRAGRSNAGATSYLTSKEISSGQWYTSPAGDTTHIRIRDTIRVAIVEGEDYAEDASVLKAVLRAAGAVPGIAITVTTPANADWTFWISKEEPARPITSKTVLLRPGAFDGWIVPVDKHEWRLTRRITQDDALKEHLAVELAGVLLKDLPHNPKTISNDVRSLPVELMWSSEENAPTMKVDLPEARDVGTWLIFLFIITWGAERTLALSKNL
jgi:hypothetical protein